MSKKKNINELAEQYNNYIYPKPCQDIDEEWLKFNRYQVCDPNYFWHKIWPEKKYSRNPLKILIAGCGSDQAAILAKCNPIHKFIGIDISKNSLEHQKKLISRHDINNLELICDDFRNFNYTKKFDYIISSGVIHHLDNINSALEYFYKNLKDDGAIFIMIYGNQQSQNIDGIKKVFKKLSFSHNKKSINSVRQIISKLKNYHPAKIFSNLFADIENDSGVIDTFLHKNENFYNIKQFINILEKNNLIIKNFVDSRIAPITKYFMNNKDELEKIKQMHYKDKLEISQILNWNDRKINLICSKKHKNNKTFIYNKVDLDECYLYQSSKINYQVNERGIRIIDTENEINFDIKTDKQVNWKLILSGTKKMSEITENMNKNVKKNLYENLNFLLENYVLDFAFYKIENYKNYYAK